MTYLLYISMTSGFPRRHRFTLLDELAICARYQEGEQPETIARDFNTNARRIDEIRVRLGVPAHTDHWSFRRSARVTRIDNDHRRVFVVQRGAMVAVVAVADRPLKPVHAAQLNHVTATKVLGDGSGVMAFFAQHKTRSIRDETLVLAAWFKRAKKRTFTPGDIVEAAPHVGRTYSKQNARFTIANIARDGDFTRVARGLYALTNQGLVHTKLLFAGPMARTIDERTRISPPARSRGAAPTA